MTRREFSERCESLIDSLWDLHRDYCGPDVLLTLVARVPSNPARNGVFTADSLPAAIAVLERYIVREQFENAVAIPKGGV